MKYGKENKMKSQQNLQPVHTHTHTHEAYYRRKSIIKVVIFLLILIILIEIIYSVTKRKYSYEKMVDFFSQEENFDVLFFGSSHVLNGIFPMQLWEEYGIISYNLGNHSEHIVTSYNQMLLALMETNPKLIVIDAYMVYSEDRYKTIEHLHNTLDAYPLSYQKYLAIKDIFYDKYSIDRCMEFLFNFSMYHARWMELEEADFKNTNVHEKGAKFRINVAEAQEISDFNSVGAYSGSETINMEYLRKMIEYCKQNNIEILVTSLPNQASDEDIAYSKYVQTICDEYEVNYINFLGMNIINENTDYYNTEDSNAHLNPSGARKVTSYLGEYIIENYDIQDQRKNEAYSFWYADYDAYIDLKIENLKENSEDLNNYLMLLYGEEDISYEITISSKQEIEKESTLEELLQNLNNNYQINDDVFLQENEETGELEQMDKTIKITTWDIRTGEEIQTVWF